MLTQEENQRAYKTLKYISIFAYLLSISGYFLALVVAPLTPFWAALKIFMWFFPLIALAWHQLANCIERNFVLAKTHLQTLTFTENNLHLYYNVLLTGSPYLLYGVCFVSSGIAIIALGFSINYFYDHSNPTTITATILEKDYHSGKSSKHYYVIVSNPNPPLFSFIKSNLMEIKVHDEDYPRIAEERTQISFPLYEGALGLPWTKNYTYALINAEKITPDYQASTTPPHSNFGNIRAACDWTKNFDASKEIETITPDDYQRDFWPFSDKPRAVIPLVKGEKHGFEHDTFKNGVVYTDLPWKHGKKHGTFTLHRDDGSIEQKLSYKNGEPYGINQWYNKDGTLSQAYLYLEGDKTMSASVCGKK